MGLFDIFKKKTEPDLFTYNEHDKEFTASLDGIEFTARIPVTPDMAAYAKQLAAAYRDRLPAIADYILKDEAFDHSSGIFPGISKDTLMSSLNMPTIQLLSDHDGACTYYDHALDDTHILTFEFSALFDNFCYLSVDG